jgi:hypothetical protein
MASVLLRNRSFSQQTKTALLGLCKSARNQTLGFVRSRRKERGKIRSTSRNEFKGALAEIQMKAVGKPNAFTGGARDSVSVHASSKG